MVRKGSAPGIPIVRFRLAVLVVLVGVAAVGCGTTREMQATDQLLLSDAVDRSVEQIDFHPLAGHTVFLDTQYLKQAAETGYVNSNYVISSLRQQMFQAGCLVQESKVEADFIVEPRIGTLGSDGHEVSYGLPASNTLNAAATVIGNAPALPVLPEISLARRTRDTAAVKLAVFAYHRETKQTVWQSGLSVGRSNVSGHWVLGAGPFQRGTIYNGTMFAGEKIAKVPVPMVGLNQMGSAEDQLAHEESPYRSAAIWAPETLRRPDDLPASETEQGVQVTRYEEADSDNSADPSAPPAAAEVEAQARCGLPFCRIGEDRVDDDRMPGVQDPAASL